MIIDEALFKSDSPYEKAADHVDMNTILSIESVGEDEYEDDKGAVTKFVYIKFTKAEKPIKVSKGNLKILVGQLSPDTGAWIGRKVNLSTKEWDINGNKTVGWVMTPLGDEPDDAIPF